MKGASELDGAMWMSSGRSVLPSARCMLRMMSLRSPMARNACSAFGQTTQASPPSFPARPSASKVCKRPTRSPRRNWSSAPSASDPNTIRPSALANSASLRSSPVQRSRATSAVTRSRISSSVCGPSMSVASSQAPPDIEARLAAGEAPRRSAASTCRLSCCPAKPPVGCRGRSTPIATPAPPTCAPRTRIGDGSPASGLGAPVLRRRPGRGRRTAVSAPRQ